MSQKLPYAVYLEVGKKKTFAGALDWPGWCRSGRDEASALSTLLDYRSRYARVLAHSGLEFEPPRAIEGFDVVQRLQGNSTTDFGAPDIAPRHDETDFDDAQRARTERIFEGIWREFDRVVSAAEGHNLRKGPRGGGRDLEKIVRHVVGAEAAYLRAIGQNFRTDDAAPIAEELQWTREAVRRALLAAARGEIPQRGPRGGRLWMPHYYVRRTAWHALDHAWEIGDRIQ